MTTKGSKRKGFFALPEELVTFLGSVEEIIPLQYVDTNPIGNVFPRAGDIPNLGTSVHGDTNLDPFYLVARRGERVHWRSVHLKRGGTTRAIDQGNNPNTVVLWPGGLFEERCLVAGEVATASPAPDSLEMFRAFASVIRKQFRRIQAFWVSPGAETMLDRGMRLTQGVRSAPWSDLQKPSQ